MSDAIEERFRKAVYLMKYGPRLNMDNSVKLLFYSYYKQVGKVSWESLLNLLSAGHEPL